MPAAHPPPPRRDPLAGVDRLLVDGNNLLHALRRGSAEGPAAAVVGRLRAAVPADVAIEIVFDGPPAPGSSGRVASGIRVRYAGTRSADAVLVAMVEQAGQPEPGTDPPILVCTDDTELRRILRHRGAATVGTGWLIRRLEHTRLSAPSVGGGRPAPGPSSRAGTSVGHGRPPAPGQGAGDGSADGGGARPGWRPGRGATAKSGNPRRASKRASRRPGPGC